jgi:hypothetical protein
VLVRLIPSLKLLRTFHADRLRAAATQTKVSSGLRLRSELFATVLYSALCNTTWLHKATGTPWHCSWRSAGGLVANLRCEGNYLDWYCSMGEGLVDEQVLDEIGALGWELAAADSPEC